MPGLRAGHRPGLRRLGRSERGRAPRHAPPEEGIMSAPATYVAIQNRPYPDAAQEAVMAEHCGHARFVWNLAVEQQSWWRPGRGNAPGGAERQRQLTEARAAEP